MTLSVPHFVVLSILIFQFSSALSQQPNWTAVTTGLESDYFVDVNRLRKEGDFLSFWVLETKKLEKQPYTSRAGKEYLSVISQYSADCPRTSTRIQAEFLYSERQGKGEIVTSQNLSRTNFEVFPPNSVGEGLVQFACAKFVQRMRAVSSPKPTPTGKAPAKASSPF